MTTDTIKLQYHTISEQGMRKRQEDDFFPHANQEHNNLFFVCDGIGGHGDGDLAAAFVQMQLANELLDRPQVSKINMNAAILETDTKLKFYAQQVQNPKMGSTVAAIQFENEYAVLGWVGDSRIYQIREGQIHYKTTDHTLVELMLENGELSVEEAAAFPLKNVIYQAVGPIDQHIKPSVEKLCDIKLGDVFLLATDGIFEAWKEEELPWLFSNSNIDAPNEIHERCKAVSKDNFTFTIVTIV